MATGLTSALLWAAGALLLIAVSAYVAWRHNRTGRGPR